MIDIKYILTENDFLQLNLYYFKVEGKLKKLILKTWIAYSIISTMLIGILFWKNEIYIALIFLIGYLIFSIIHSERMKSVYFKHFQKSIKAYQTRFNKEVKLKISDSQLHMESIVGNTDFNLSQIDSIVETKNHFFIKLNPEAIIIPKSRVEKPDSLKHDLVLLTEKLNLKYYSDLEWRW